MEGLRQKSSVSGLVADGGGHQLYELWRHYEQIAVHFNDLILRLRTQALGGVAAVTVTAGIVMNHNADEELFWNVLAVAFAVVGLLWIALFLLDLLYYNRLLLGAVDAILELEDASSTQTTWREIRLSHKIKDAVEGAGPKWRLSLIGPLVFYGLVLITLVALFIFAVLGPYEN